MKSSDEKNMNINKCPKIKSNNR